MPLTPPTPESLHGRIRIALMEDLGDAGDVTSKAVFPAEHRSKARILAKESGRLSGLSVVKTVFGALDPEVSVQTLIEDGSDVAPGDVVATLEGPTRSLLSGERTALNFLQRMSGIATLTNKFVKAARRMVAVCDTRKTTPMWRDIEKYAVACGGGTNHRMGLFDMAMLKDTHADGSGGLKQALERIRAANLDVLIAAEARDLEEVAVALEAGVDLLMLDNMDDDTLKAAIAKVDGKATIEITGGVTLETIGKFAEMGVDRVSVGALTHSVKALDFSMRIDLGEGSTA